MRPKILQAEWTVLPLLLCTSAPVRARLVMRVLFSRTVLERVTMGPGALGVLLLLEERPKIDPGSYLLLRPL